jgi:viroplasmin and RNaseH domain-containing protein
MARKKYYAVKRGRQPGIFDSWEACQACIQNFGGAIFKGFATYEEAEAWYRGEGGASKLANAPSQASRPRAAAAPVPLDRPPTAGPCYAVRRGHRTGIFGTWSECQEAVKGFPGAQYKKFNVYEKALTFLQGTPAAIPPVVQQMRERPPGEHYLFITLFKQLYRILSTLRRMLSPCRDDKALKTAGIR